MAACAYLLLAAVLIGQALSGPARFPDVPSGGLDVKALRALSAFLRSHSGNQNTDPTRHMEPRHEQPRQQEGEGDIAAPSVNFERALCPGEGEGHFENMCYALSVKSYCYQQGHHHGQFLHEQGMPASTIQDSCKTKQMLTGTCHCEQKQALCMAAYAF
eukprot:scpid107854/ scgid30142/ 